MKRHNPRSLRLADQIQRDLVMLIRDLQDPRIGMITLTRVEVSSDYAHASVYFTRLAGAEQVQESLQGLQHAAGFLRSGLAHLYRMHSVPQLHFLYDDSIESGFRLSSLIDQAVEADRKLHKD